MRFRGGGVGHLGTRHLDSRMKDYSQEVEGDGAEEDLGTHEERTIRGEPEPSNREDEEEEDEDEDEDTDEDAGDDADEDAGEDAGEEQEESGNVNDEQDIDDDSEDEEAMDDDEILDEEGFAEL
jgi:hypothetical protein